jgi:NADH:ubiquinone oxidoreductase subunit 4 (subunit M)
LADFLAIFGLVGGLLIAFVCLVQVDIKALVAYSSVVHIGLLLAGIRTVFLSGYVGALCMIVGHGVVSSGLFYLVGCRFDRSGRRRLLVGKGLIIIFPAITLF